MSKVSDIDKNFIRQFAPLDEISEGNLRELIAHTKQLSVSKGKILFKRGQANKYLFYVYKGSVDLLDADFSVEKITAPSERSRQTLELEDPHDKTAVTTSEVKILSICKDRLDLVLTWDQAGNYLVKDIAEDDQLIDGDWMAALLGSQLFQQVPPANLQQLFVKFVERNISKGEAIIREGEQGDTFYVIQNGKAAVTRKADDGSTVALANLGPGQYFGQEALIGDTTRNATVTMLTDGILMHLGKDDFKKLLEEPVVHYIKPEEASALLSSKKAQLLDVRLPVEIPPNDRKKRLIIPLADLRKALQTLNSDITYIVCQEGGRRSVLGAYLLNEAGFLAVVVRTRNTGRPR